MDVLDHLGIEGDGGVHVGHLRAVDVVVALHADAVHRHAGVFHPLDEVVDALALGRLGVIVIVVEEQGFRVGRVGILEGLVDELFAGDLEHRGVAEFALARADRAVGHGLIDHVPGIDHVFVAVHDGIDVVLHVGIEFFFGEELAILVLIHPGADLAMPHQGVTAHLDAVLAAEVGDPVGIFPVEFALAGLGRLGLHRVLGGDAVEFALDQGHLRFVGDVAVVHGGADQEVVLVGVFKAVGGRGDRPLAKLSKRRKGPE